MDCIKIAMVEDHKLFRMGVDMGLKNHNSSIQILEEFENGEDFLKRIPEIKAEIDLVLLDIVLPGVSGIEIAKHLNDLHPEVKILVLSTETSEETIIELMHLNIKGFISKNIGFLELVKAIELVSEGGNYYGKDIASIMMCTYIAKKDIAKTIHFTIKELEIISLSCEGLQRKEISDKMNISPRTVDTHKTNIFKKLGLSNSIELVRYAIKNNIISI